MSQIIWLFSGKGGSRLWVVSICRSVVASYYAGCCSCSTVCIVSSSVSVEILVDVVESRESSLPEMESSGESVTEMLIKELDELVESLEEVLGVLELIEKVSSMEVSGDRESGKECLSLFISVTSFVRAPSFIVLTVLQWSGLHLWWLPKQCNALFKMSSCNSLAAVFLSTLFV